MTLDLAVARAVAQSLLLERALHSQGLWEIEIGGRRVVATRKLHDHGVIFAACFAGVPAEADAAVLIEDGQERSWRPFAHPGLDEFCLSWDLALEESVPA